MQKKKEIDLEKSSRFRYLARVKGWYSNLRKFLSVTARFLSSASRDLS